LYFFFQIQIALILLNIAACPYYITICATPYHSRSICHTLPFSEPALPQLDPVQHLTYLPTMPPLSVTTQMPAL